MANNIQQEYKIGELFNVYDWSKLSANDEWKWPCRTLVGFRREDGLSIALGGETTFDDKYAQVSGIWELSRIAVPLSIYFCGQSGKVSVSVSACNVELPLANADHPCIIDYGTFDSDSAPSAETSSFYYTNITYLSGQISNTLSILIQADEGTTLNRIYGKNISYVHEYQQNTTSSLIYMTCPFAKIEWTNTQDISIDNVYAGSGIQQWNSLSIYFTENGTLEYIPNTNTLNPNHPQD